MKFFVAPDDTSAALTLQTGPARAFEVLSFGNFDPEEAVVEWECLLAGGSFEEVVGAGEPRIVAGQDNGGCVVFALSPRLSTALADAEQSRLGDVAAAWAQSRAADGEVIDTAVADAIVGDLAASSAVPDVRTRASTAGSRKSSCAEPDGDGSGRGGAEEDVSALVVASGDRSGLLQAVDCPLDGTALLVAVPVKAGWPSPLSLVVTPSQRAHCTQFTLVLENAWLHGFRRLRIRWGR
ncbi:hypothetical protein ACWDFL_36325 [Streptomyces bungoensis]